jgi:hypothetical protein
VLNQTCRSVARCVVASRGVPRCTVLPPDTHVLLHAVRCMLHAALCWNRYVLRAQLTRVGLYMLREVLLNGVAVPLTSAASAPLVVVPGAVGAPLLTVLHGAAVYLLYCRSYTSAAPHRSAVSKLRTLCLAASGHSACQCGQHGLSPETLAKYPRRHERVDRACIRLDRIWLQMRRTVSSTALCCTPTLLTPSTPYLNHHHLLRLSALAPSGRCACV